MSRITVFLFQLLLLTAISAQAEKKKKSEDNHLEKRSEISSQKVQIDGQEITYQVTAATTTLPDSKGKARASIFHVSYIKSGEDDVSKRPVMFAFNGGPGSSSVWLHLGMLGPRRVELQGDGTIAAVPPARLVENPYSLLDVCDLVFIDPVSTGFSRPEGQAKPKDFYGINEDIVAISEFIRIWVTENKRWSSPKYLCGESYGGVRAAGLAEYLQRKNGMSLNGVILLSALLDYRTLSEAQGSHLAYQVYLPAYATTALHHGKISGAREEILKKAKNFAFGPYATALLKGSELGSEEMKAIAAQLSKFTGIPEKRWILENLRLSPSEFRAELLRGENKNVGRFDSRVAWETDDPSSEHAKGDPSYALVNGAFSTAMLTYLGEKLNWIEKDKYEIIASVGPWNYGSGNQIVNMMPRLQSALMENPKLKVLIMGGYADLATPPEGMEYTIRQAVGLPKHLRDNITFSYYDAGHMFYLNPKDLEKGREDLIEFLQREP